MKNLAILLPVILSCFLLYCSDDSDKTGIDDTLAKQVENKDQKESEDITEGEETEETGETNAKTREEAITGDSPVLLSSLMASGDITQFQHCSYERWFIWCENGTTEIRYAWEIEQGIVCETKQILLVTQPGGTFLMDENETENCYMKNGFRTRLDEDAVYSSDGRITVTPALGSIPNCELTSGWVIADHVQLPDFIPGTSSYPDSAIDFPEYPNLAEDCNYISYP